MNRSRTPLLLCASLLLMGGSSVFAQHVGYCGVDHAFEKSLPDVKDAKPLSPTLVRQRDQVGITWRIAFADVNESTGIGFDHPEYGAEARQRLLDVLDYLNDILDHSGVVDLQVNRSETDRSGPLATAGTFFSGSPGPFVGTGWTAITGASTSTNTDIFMTVDFGYTWNTSLDYPAFGQSDLYSVLLHEMGHGLGFLSFRGDNNNYSKFAEFLHSGNGRRIFGPGGTVAADAESLMAGNDGGLFSRAPLAVESFCQFMPVQLVSGGHWADNSAVYNTRPVMNPFIISGTVNRVFHPMELELLADLGYNVRRPARPEPTSTRVIDGQLHPAEGYTALAANERASFGTNQAVFELHAAGSATDLSLFLEMNSSFNNAAAIFLDFAGTEGSGSGVVPAGASGLAARMAGYTLPLSDIDLVISLNSGDNDDGFNRGENDAACYVDWSRFSGGTAQNVYLGADTVIDRVADISRTLGPPEDSPTLTAGSVEFAYSDGCIGTCAGACDEGFEILLPYTAIPGADPAGAVRMVVVFGNPNNGFLSNSTLPALESDIIGGASPHIGNTAPVDLAAGTTGNGSSWIPAGPQLFQAQVASYVWRVF